MKVKSKLHSWRRLEKLEFWECLLPFRSESFVFLDLNWKPKRTPWIRDRRLSTVNAVPKLVFDGTVNYFSPYVLPTTDMSEISFSVVVVVSNKSFKWAFSKMASEYISCFPYPIYIANWSWLLVCSYSTVTSDLYKSRSFSFCNFRQL